MNFRIYKVIFIIFLQLILLEGLLEYRAYRRGWSSLLFGDTLQEEKVDNKKGEIKYGPNPQFLFRSEIITPERKRGVFRIWIASSSMGVHGSLPPDKIFPNLIEQNLEKLGIPAEIINASKGGKPIKGSAKDLDQLGPIWQPDIAILYNMSNDVNQIARRMLSANSSEVNESHLPTESLSILPSFIKKTFENTTIYAHLKEHITSKVAQCGILADNIGQKVEIEFRMRVKAFVKTCRVQNIQPVLCTFATSHNRKLLPWPPELLNWLFRWCMYLYQDTEFCFR